MCVYLSLILSFYSLSVSVPNKILLRYSLRVSEFCYAFVRKRTTISEDVGVCVFCVYLSRHGVHLYLGRAPFRCCHVEACNSHLTVHVPLPEGLLAHLFVRLSYSLAE